MQTKNFILISYKSKLLLKSIDSPFEKGAWGLIGEEGAWSRPPIDSAIDIVKKTTKLNIKVIHKLPLKNEKLKYIFCVKLTDKNVNSIVRDENQRLEFYTLREAEKLNLTTTTGDFILNHQGEIKTFLSEQV